MKKWIAINDAQEGSEYDGYVFDNQKVYKRILYCGHGKIWPIKPDSILNQPMIGITHVYKTYISRCK